MRWGSTTRLGFGQNRAGSRKTFLGGGRFCVEEAPPVWVFGKITPGQGKPFWVEAAFALGKHHPFGFWTKSRNFRKNAAWTCQKTVQRNILLYCFPILHFLLYFSYDFRRLTQNHLRARHPAEGHLQGTWSFPKLHERTFERKKGILIGFAGETVRFFASRYKTC